MSREASHNTCPEKQVTTHVMRSKSQHMSRKASHNTIHEKQVMKHRSLGTSHEPRVMSHESRDKTFRGTRVTGHEARQSGKSQRTDDGPPTAVPFSAPTRRRCRRFMEKGEAERLVHTVWLGKREFERATGTRISLADYLYIFLNKVCALGRRACRRGRSDATQGCCADSSG